MKKFVSIVMVFLMVFGLAACGDSGGGGADAEVIKVGWIGALSGDQAPWGKCESQARQMYIDEQNAAGGVLGKQLELVTYDTKGDANESVNAVKRLIANDGVVAILGPNASASAIAIKGALNEGKVPDIATVATNPEITVNKDGSINEFNFRVCFTDPYQGAVAGGYAADEMGAKTAAVLYDVASDYSQGFTEFFVETFEAKGGKVVAQEGFKAGDTDFRPQLTKIKEADPDVILMPYFYKEVALSANQARELGIDAVFMGGDGWPSDTLFEMAGPAIEGSYVVNHFDYNDPAAAEITAAYQEKYQVAPEINAYMVHDAFDLLVAAIEKAGSADSEAIAAALTQVEVVGVTGTIKLGEDTHDPVGKEASMQQIVKSDTAADGYEYKFIMRYTPDN
ncbi:MAG: ABC transporter substrate-binding protein [Firmicutes bacterium]|nr:ABC transporter substrate-binding protein [Bacillota bacterium]